MKAITAVDLVCNILMKIYNCVQFKRKEVFKNFFYQPKIFLCICNVTIICEFKDILLSLCLINDVALSFTTVLINGKT